MRKLILFLLSLGLIFGVSADTYETVPYTTDGQVTATNLNNNFNLPANQINGNLDNTNADTAEGFRFYESLGSTPSAGTEGRMVYNTATKVLAIDDGSTFNDIGSGDGTFDSISVDHDSTDTGVYIQQDGNLASSEYGLHVTSTIAQTNDSSSLVRFDQYTGSDQNVMELTNDGTGNGIELTQSGTLAAGENALLIKSSESQGNSYIARIYSNNGTGTGLLHLEADNASDTGIVLYCQSDYSGASNEVINISNAGTRPSIRDDSGALLSASGVWTDAPCTLDEKEDVQEADTSSIIDKLNNLKLYNYKKKREIYGAKEYILSDTEVIDSKKIKEKKDKIIVNGDKYVLKGDKYNKVIGRKYGNKKINNNPKTYTGYILDDPSTPEELVSKDEEGNIIGISPMDGVNFLLGVCQEQQKQIDDLTKRIEALEGN